MRRYFLFSVAWFFLAVPGAIAQWNLDTELNTPVCTATGWQSPAALISDGTLGAYAVWLDDRGNDTVPAYDLYAQHIYRYGTNAWYHNGILLARDATFYMHFEIVEDHKGGFILAYERVEQISNEYNRSISVLHVSDRGEIEWRVGNVFSMNHKQGRQFSAVSDGSGGIVIAQSYPVGDDPGNILAQRIDANGNKMWGSAGRVICRSAGAQFRPILALGSGDLVYISWEDDRSYQATNPSFEVYLQQISHDGENVWSEPGILVTDKKYRHGNMKLVSSPDGDVTAVWSDARYLHPETSRSSDDTGAVFAQRISPKGNPLWEENGVHVSQGLPIKMGGNGDIQSIQVATNRFSSATIAWCHNNGDHYGQRINPDGTLGYNGGVRPRFLVNNTAHAFYRFGMAPDMDGGMFLTYIRETDSTMLLNALRVDSSGIVDWLEKPVSSSPGKKDITFGAVLPHIISDGHGGFFAAWSDTRNDAGDVYISRVSRSGNPFPVELSSFTATKTGPHIVLQWETRSERHNRGFTVQRSANDRHWIDIGFVQGAGEPGRYTFTDSNKPESAATLKYRLRQMDFDGSTTYSPVVSVGLTVELPGGMELGEVYPNPALGNAHFSLRLDTGKRIDLTVTNALGVPLWSRSGVFPKGSTMVAIPVHSLSPGFYLLRAESPETLAIHKFIVR